MSGKSASPARQPEFTAAADWMARRHRRLRVLLLLSGMLALLAGICGGLWRLGWTLPHGADLAAFHGPLMISGLFGTLISLERAVALGGNWPYLGPALAACGSLALVAGAPAALGASAYMLASGTLILASLRIARAQPSLFSGALLLGATAWMAGNLLWLAGGSVSGAVGWWLAFLILTIAGERLEMSRLLGPRRGSRLLFATAAGLLSTGAAAGLDRAMGEAAFGCGLLVTLAWLLRHDIACRTIRQTGQTRFFAVCMLAGYPWLGVAGFVLLAQSFNVIAASYDSAIHAITVGFVLSMVFGHALIILPAVTGLAVRYHPVLYAPLALLHASVFLRLAALVDMDVARSASGVLTVIAMVTFAACVIALRFLSFNTVGARPAPILPAKERISP